MSASLFTLDVLRLPGFRIARGNRRQHARFACCFPATIRYDGTHHDNDGLLLEISCAGVVFREASLFVMDRAGTVAEIRSADLTATGRIVRSDQRGHAIRLHTPLNDEQVTALVDEFGLDRSN